MEKPNIAAIDGDLIAYKAAAAVEKRYIMVTHIKSGNQKRFDTRTEFYGHHAKKEGGWLGEKNQKLIEVGSNPFSVEDFTIEDFKDVEPVENACQIAKTMVKGIAKASGVSNYEVYLTGEGNFRDEIATIYGYKADRANLDKPDHVQAVKDYLVTQHGAKYVHGMEADDMLAIKAFSGEAIQCSVDKDQLQVAGWMFDFEKSEKPFEIPRGLGKLWVGSTEGGKEKIRGYGFKHLCFQMLIGDTVDCIFPKYLCKAKYGEKTAFADLDKTKTMKECLQVVLNKYKEWYPDPIVHKHWKTGEPMTKNYFDIASEMFSLLYMLRTPDDKTTLKKVCKYLKIKV